MQSFVSLISIDEKKPQPVYGQIANQLADLIKGGVLTIGHRLLSTRDMAGQFAGIREAFDDEQVRAVGDGDEHIHPLGITGISEALHPVAEHDRGRGCARIMQHFGGGDGMTEHVGRTADLDLHHFP